MDTSNLYKIISIKNFYIIDELEKLTITSEIEKNYKKYYDPNLGHNFEIKDYSSIFFDNLYDKFLEISYKIFGNFSICNNNRRTCWCYRSCEKNFNSVWHSHKNTSTINGVYYYQIQDGDSISFLDKDKEEMVYYLSEGELIIFSNNLVHKPNIPISIIPNRYRYSINVEIMTKESSEKIFNRI